jgi:transposase
MTPTQMRALWMLRSKGNSCSGSAARRASAAGLTWKEVEGIDDGELERRLYPQVAAVAERPEPDCVWIHRERHRPNVTLELLHHEYLERHPNGLRYTTFCDRYRAWLGRRGLVMRQVHTAGDKAFVDYSGRKPRIVDAATGEVIEVELFVAALGASNLTYAEATYTQRGPDWIGSHVRMLEYFGGVPAALVPDQSGPRPGSPPPSTTGRVETMLWAWRRPTAFSEPSRLPLPLRRRSARSSSES